MSLLKIQNHRDSMVVLRREARDVNGVLTPDELEIKSGANNIDAARLALFRANPIVEQFFACGMLEEQGAVVEADQEALPAHGGNLAKLKEKAALRVIAACTDPRQLKIWVQQDGRDKIRDALIARHTELTNGLEPGELGKDD